MPASFYIYMYTSHYYGNQLTQGVRLGVSVNKGFVNRVSGRNVGGREGVGLPFHLPLMY